jgi:hypothetical protein
LYLGVEELLNSPVLSVENFDIKFKRTDQLIDRYNFILKTSMNDPQDKINENRVQLYTSLLVGGNIKFTIDDRSTMNEQIFLIQCNNEIG